LLSNNYASFIGKYGQHWWDKEALKHGMNCGTIHASTCLVVGYCHKWQYPNTLWFAWCGFAVSHVRVILLRGSSQFLADFQGQIQFHLKRGQH
jgi:hypothetical protein